MNRRALPAPQSPLPSPIVIIVSESVPSVGTTPLKVETMFQPSSSRRAMALLLAGTLVFAACGGDDEGATPVTGDESTTTAATDSGETETTEAESETPAEAPEDLCAIIDLAAVQAALGEPNVVSKTSPSGGCEYSSDERNGLTPNVEISPDVDGAGGLEGAREGIELTLSTTAEDLVVGDDTGYFATGQLGGFNSTQAAISHGGYIIFVNMLGEAAATRQDVAVALLQATVNGL